MKRRIIWLPLIVLIAGSVVDLHGQIPQPPVNDRGREAENKIEAERKLRMQNMREFDTTMKAANKPDRSVPASPTIDKETGERIRQARRVDATDFARYSDFLKADKTGIFKLFPDYDCVTKDVIRVEGDCKNFVMASSSFSFRTLGYSHPFYHDLGFNNGEIFGNAFFSQGIIVSLGNVPIEDEAAHRDGSKFILEFQTATDPGKAKVMAARLKAGFESGGFTYSSAVKPVENSTYILRSVAYDVANSLPVVSETTSLTELRFHTLALDKRADITIVFRIVRMGADGSLTIVWKELERKEAPKIKFSKGEKFADFKPETAQTRH